MTGLFEDIRGFFKAKYSGRYLALLLRELGRREPKTFAKFFGISGKSLMEGDLQIEYEWNFQSKKGVNARADLAVLEAGNPLLLIEIKEDDSRSASNAEQFDSYLSMLNVSGSERSLGFFLLSRYALPNDQDEKLKQEKQKSRSVIQKRYRDLYESLRSSDGEFSRMLLEYLEDIGVTSYQTIDLASQKKAKALEFLLARMLGFKDKHGYGRLQSDNSVTALPDIFKVFLGNLEVLADRIRNQNPDLFSQRFSRSFSLHPRFDLKSLKKSLSKDESREDQDYLPEEGRFVKSGSVYFYSDGKICNPRNGKSFLGKGDWLYVTIGYGLDIPGEGMKVCRAGIYLYAKFSYRGQKDEAYTPTDYLKAFPSEEDAMGGLKQCLRDAHAEAIRLAPKPYRDILRLYKVRG